MRAVVFKRFGGPEVLEVVELPTPQPASGQLLVRVHAAGVNFADTLLRQDRYAVTPPLPFVPGSEVAGTVERVGAEVDGIAVGARVAAPLFFPNGAAGGYAEVALIDAALAVPVPDALPFPAAVALMVQGLTALHLTERIAPAGKSVFICAAAGGVGSLLVQLARRAGAARVIAAASSPSKLDVARALGADAGVDYSKPEWVEQARSAAGSAGPDIIYESTGGAVTRACLELLAPKGEIVLYGALNIQAFALGVPELLGLIFKNQRLTGFAVVPLMTPESLRSSLTTLFALAARGEVQVTLGGNHPLEGAADAHRALEGRGTTGKLVLVP